MTKPNSMEFQSTLKNLLENYGYKNLSVIGQGAYGIVFRAEKG